MRPLRGGQGTFDRIIENIRSVAGRTRISIGGNFDESSADSFPALLDFLKEQDFADKLVKVNFKPIVREASRRQAEGHAAADAGRTRRGKTARRLVHDVEPAPAADRRATAAPSWTRRWCSLREETAASRVRDVRRRAHGPVPRAPRQRPHDRSGRLALRAARVYRRKGAVHRPHQRNHRPLARANKKRFDTLDPWKACGDCAFIPVCAGDASRLHMHSLET